MRRVSGAFRAVWLFVVSLVILLACVSTAAVEYFGSGGGNIPTTRRPPFTVSPPFTIAPPVTPRPECRDPEECCRFRFGSDDFDICCEEHGCCPMTCPLTDEDGMILPTYPCQAWECCVHREGSPRHQDCCRRHGCCPHCKRVPSGCCFNDVRYTFGSLVMDLPDACVQLVCAAKLYPLLQYPLLQATIVAVKTCSFSGVMEECLGCPVYHCVDEFGLQRMDGDTWSPSPCVKCECRQGHQRCVSILARCLPPPHPKCIPIPGPCCPTYHCEDGCVDEDGNFRPVGAQWPTSDPCQMMLCTETGIETINTACLPPPPPHEGCFLQNVPGQCCSVWNCSRCIDTDGSIHQLHDEWQAGPCIVKVCTTSGIVVRDTICPKLGPAPHDTCYRDIQEGGCCEEWKCDGCWVGDELHPPGSQWPSDDPCFNNVCREDTVVLQRVDCPDFPRPHESCFEHIPDGACCPGWNCSGCLDDNGTYHPLYHEWQIDPCTTLVCHLNGITKRKIPCPPLGSAPHSSCYTVFLPGGCCKEWKCDGCIDDTGEFHPLGSEWPSSDPCVRMLCVPPGVIQNATVACQLSLRPHEGCFFQTVEGQCCGQWNCSGCRDNDGKFRKLLEKWKSDPCTTHICTSIGVKTEELRCTSPPRPHYSCKLVVLPDHCCPSWECKHGRSSTSCYDDEGNEYENGRQWAADEPCMIHRCDSGTIITEPVQCDDKPTPPNCFEEQMEGECCPKWNCSGCMSKDGVYHKLDEVWKVAPCILQSCHESGIHEAIVDCAPGPPHPGCRQWFDPEECCPQWDCSDCLDEEGNFRMNGTTWMSPSDSCIIFTCLNSEVEKSLIACDVIPPPSPNCILSTEEDQCCPTWNCSGCLDQAGEFHSLGESWVSSCMTHHCTPRGIITEDVKCDDAPRPDCVPEPPRPGGCCPTWNCGEVPLNCSVVKCQGPPWNAICVAHMAPRQCCPVYSCRPPHPIPDMPKCASVYCLGPPLHEYCMARYPPGQCCPRYFCRPTTEPTLPTECASVLCLAPPPNVNCTVTTPPGECCPVFDCDTSTTTSTTTTTTRATPTTPATTTGPPPQTSGTPLPGKDCVDEQGGHRKEGEVWRSSEDGCRKSQCHQGLIVYHYEC
ncbi:kielin/chordin-like protein isoform X1 [Scylla paramamosain]|uniref:kielin/chordin-like protein isoform X1 n=1 Tax=Scylla paramamosain TaxID=85552 RepID=UPI003083C2ED